MKHVMSMDLLGGKWPAIQARYRAPQYWLAKVTVTGLSKVDLDTADAEDQWDVEARLVPDAKITSMKVAPHVIRASRDIWPEFGTITHARLDLHKLTRREWMKAQEDELIHRLKMGGNDE